jgi:hypothetical protein
LAGREIHDDIRSAERCVNINQSVDDFFGASEASYEEAGAAATAASNALPMWPCAPATAILIAGTNVLPLATSRLKSTVSYRFCTVAEVAHRDNV